MVGELPLLVVCLATRPLRGAGLILVGGAAFFPPRISFATFSTCSVIGQLTSSLVLDGWVAREHTERCLCTARRCFAVVSSTPLIGCPHSETLFSRSLSLPSTGFLRKGKVPVKAIQIVGVGLVVVSTVLFGRAKTVARRNAIAAQDKYVAAEVVMVVGPDLAVQRS